MGEKIKLAPVSEKSEPSEKELSAKLQAIEQAKLQRFGELMTQAEEETGYTIGARANLVIKSDGNVGCEVQVFPVKKN